MDKRNNSGVVIAGLALFSMFFGAGDLVWPFILGGTAGDQNLFAVLGLLVTGVSLPLLGLIAMLLYSGDYLAFFGRLGKWMAIPLIFLIQAVLGPVGSIPRLLTLAHATLKPYMPMETSLIVFSIIAGIVVLCCTLKKHFVIELLGMVLTPLLLVCMATIVLVGWRYHPDPVHVAMSSSEAFSEGINTGYRTLDLIASFIFAPFVLTHFLIDSEEKLETKEGKMIALKKMLKSSLLAAFLLSLMFMGLAFISSFYSPVIGEGFPPEERLSAIAIYLLGPHGGFISCVAVSLACLTTAIPLVAIAAEYLQDTLCRGKLPYAVPQISVLVVSAAIANLGFVGIANMLDPLLQLLCPFLILLCIYNIISKLFSLAPGTEKEESVVVTEVGS